MAQFVITEDQLILIKQNLVAEKKQNEGKMINEATQHQSLTQLTQFLILAKEIHSLVF